jgi:photosystem II stability/assembly factor-like uncharacterized protein
MRTLVLVVVMSLLSLVQTQPAATPSGWRVLQTEPYRGKQDDIHFATPDVGMYVNGLGRVFLTRDGGATWTKVVEKTGTFFRCVAMLSETSALAGNIGPGYFPNVSDETVLYRTEDAGTTWTTVEIAGAKEAGLVGLCALEIVREPAINAGELSEKVTIVGVGRVGGPGVFVRSEDGGKTFTASKLPEGAAMALDVHFFDRNVGLLAAGSSANVQESTTAIFRTEDGGKTWTEVHRGKRAWELTWKMSFPTKDLGFVSVQSYNPDAASASDRFILRTRDGGRTWAELPVVTDHAVRFFGVGFVDEKLGFLGGMPGGFVTRDGGETWSRTQLGRAVNKIRFVRGPDGKTLGYAVGVEVLRWEESSATHRGG